MVVDTLVDDIDGISVIIPTINEANNLKTLLPDLKAILSAEAANFEVIVVDDGSCDGTVEVAQAGGARLIERGRPLGVGSAVYDGIDAATYNYVVLMDADLSHPSDAITKMIRIARSTGADIVKPSRYVPGGGSRDTFIRELSSKAFNRIARLLLSPSYKDISGGFILCRKTCYDYPRQAKAGDFNLEFAFYNRNRRVVEIPYIYEARLAGKSKQGDLFSKALRYGIRLLSLMVRRLSCFQH